MKYHLLRALLLCPPLFWNGTVLALPPAPDTQAPSIIELPVRLSLAPLFEAAEREVPQQAGHWRSWKKTRGVNTRYRAWRGPLGFRVVGNTLQVEAHVRYQVMARKTLLGAVTLKSACGVDEPPRQAIIGVRLRLGRIGHHLRLLVVRSCQQSPQALQLGVIAALGPIDRLLGQVVAQDIARIDRTHRPRPDRKGEDPDLW